MKFYVGEDKYREPTQRPDIPDGKACFILLKGGWNDYDSIASYSVEYQDSKGRISEIGLWKIIHKDQQNTPLNLGDSFDENGLDQNFISLGQDVSYYKNLLAICGYERSVILLETLRDISWNPTLAEEFDSLSPYRNCLFRNNTADKASLYGQRIINGEQVTETHSFSYSGTIPKAECPTDIKVDFNAADLIPGRIVGIIGRNAAGKTQYLAQLAKDLVTTRRAEDTFNERLARFGGVRPAFSRVITISFSAFDKFPRPDDDRASYKYCGLRDKNGRVTGKQLESNYRENLSRIANHHRQDEWIEYMLEILDADKNNFREVLEKELAEVGNINKEELSLFSSGQAMLVNFVTSLLAWVKEKSLIIFDEPEMHLHPNAIASLFSVLNSVLRQQKSFALIATHSPQFIQEIPTKRVLVFERTGNVTESRSLQGETLGENISNLTRHIFETYEIPSHYKNVLKELSRERDYEEVLGLFAQGLSTNAKSYLLSCYQNEEES